MLRKILKILLIITGGLAGIILLLVILLRLGIFNGIIANTIERVAGNKLNGELTIGSLKGNLLGSFSFHDIYVTQNSDTLLYSSEIRIEFEILPILHKEIRIGRLLLTDTRARPVQEQDSTWNFMKLMKVTDSATAEQGNSDWRILLDDLSVRRLSADISSIDTSLILPAHAEAGLMMSASMSGDTIEVDVDSMKIITNAPDFQINELKGKLSKIGGLLKWNDIEMHFGNSLLLAEGNYSPEEKGQVNARVELSPISFDDLKTFLPDLKIYGSPDIELSLGGNQSEYNFRGKIGEEAQSVIFNGRLSDLTGNPGYFIHIDMNNIDGSFWTGDEKLKTSITGNLEISGEGFDIKENRVKLNAAFGKISYNEYSLTSTVLNTEKQKDVLTGKLKSSTFAGDLDIRYSLMDIFGKDPAYDILGSYRNVDIGNLPGIDSVTTDLNGALHITGKGITPDNLDASIKLSSDSSTVAGEALGDFNLNADYNMGDYTIELTGFGAPYFKLDANGEGNLRKNNSIDFSFEPLDPGRLSEILKMPYMNAVGNITGNISGNPDSLTLLAEISLDSIAYDTIRVKDIRSEASINIVNKAISGRIELNTGNIRAGSKGLQSTGITGLYSGNHIEADINLNVSDSLQASIKGSVDGFESPLIRIMQLGIDFNNARWSLSGDTAVINLNKEDITIDGFSLSSGDQNITVGGRFAFEGEEDITAEIKNLELQSLPLYAFLPYEVSGIMSLRLGLTGTAAQPVIMGNLSLDKLDVNGLIIDSIRGGVSYEYELLQLKAGISSGLYESVEVMLNVPFYIALNDSISVLKDGPGFSGIIRADSLNLKEISGFFPVKNMTAEGFADINVEAGNTINDPVITGSLSLRDGSFSNTQYGAGYKDIHLFASIDSSTLGLDTLSLRTGKGNLAMKGFVSLQNTDSIELNDLSLKLRADNFQAVESGTMELNFDSDLDISGTLGKPALKGEMDINSSKINIDYFNEFLSHKTDEPDPPLLIKALRDTVETTLSADTSKKAVFSGSAFFKNLEGEAVIDIPGNTWITGKDMNFELNGSVRAVKASENISLFGELNVKRGYYKLYGRNFDFERGKITFTGSAEFNPEVDIEIVYSFRDIEKEMQELRLLIKGKLLQPELSFMLDDEQVEEKDAISYIIFGKSVNQLGEGERSKISGEDVAMGAAVTQLSSVLKGVLQESAGVDVFEVTGGEDWKSGNVTIGKYITNNLFLSYDRSFDFNKQSKTANTEKIMLEYQLLRNLILKATNQEVNSGFDLIWRKTWK